MVKSRRILSSDSLEDHIVELATSGKLACAAGAAIRSQKSRGLPITSKRGNEIVKVYSDGRTEVLETLNPPIYKLPKGVKFFQNK